MCEMLAADKGRCEKTRENAAKEKDILDGKTSSEKGIEGENYKEKNDEWNELSEKGIRGKITRKENDEWKKRD